MRPEKHDKDRSNWVRRFGGNTLLALMVAGAVIFALAGRF